MSTSAEQYQQELLRCRQLFEAKFSDYGASWLAFRLPAITDQLYIKVRRVRTLEETGQNRVGESMEGEYTGLVNYGLIALMLAERTRRGLSFDQAEGTDKASILDQYDQAAQGCFELFQKKNHDYGEAWRSMRPTSYTDLILVKLLRIKQIEQNRGRVQVSEGVEGGYCDIVNYALFWLIRHRENQDPPA